MGGRDENSRRATHDKCVDQRDGNARRHILDKSLDRRDDNSSRATHDKSVDRPQVTPAGRKGGTAVRRSVSSKHILPTHDKTVDQPMQYRVTTHADKVKEVAAKETSRKKASTTPKKKKDHRVARDDHAWHPHRSHSSNGRERERRKSLDAEFLEGGTKKFPGVPIAQATVDTVIFGYDLDGGGIEESLTHLDGCAGVHFWHKERDGARYNLEDPSDEYTKGKRRVKGGPMATSMVKYAAFGDDNPMTNPDVAAADAEYRRRHEGAIGQYSEIIHKRDFNRGKKLYPNAPQAQTAVDDLILNRDLQTGEFFEKHLEETEDWWANMDGAAGVPRWNWIDQNDRFTAVLDSKDPNRLGRKTCNGAYNLESNVSRSLFNNDAPEKRPSEEDPGGEKSRYQQNLSSSAGRQVREVTSNKNRFQVQNKASRRIGKRVFSNAPQQKSFVDTVCFNVYMPDENCVEGHEWTDVIDGCAGLGYNRRADTLYGRYHIDKEHAEGKIAGKRLFGVPFTSVLVPQPEAIRRPSEGVGRPVSRLQHEKHNDPEATTTGATYRAPSETAVLRAGRRANKRDRHVQDSKAVTEVMRDDVDPPIRRCHSERSFRHPRGHEIRMERLKGPLSPNPTQKRTGDMGLSLYDRDFHQMPVRDYNKSLEIGPPVWFNHPERGWQDEEIGTREQAYRECRMHSPEYRGLAKRKYTIHPSKHNMADAAAQLPAHPAHSALHAWEICRELPAPPPEDVGLMSRSASLRETASARSGSLREAADPRESDAASRSSRRASSARGERESFDRRSGLSETWATPTPTRNRRESCHQLPTPPAT